jgi:hypothetical protein
MQFVIRDFYGPDGGGYAEVHAEGCPTLRERSVAMQAHLRDCEGSEFVERKVPDLATAEATFRRRWTVEVPITRHECVVDVVDLELLARIVANAEDPVWATVVPRTWSGLREVVGDAQTLAAAFLAIETYVAKRVAQAFVDEGQGRASA